MKIEKLGMFGFNWSIARMPKMVKPIDAGMFPKIKFSGLNSAQLDRQKMFSKESGKGLKVDYYA